MDMIRSEYNLLSRYLEIGGGSANRGGTRKTNATYLLMNQLLRLARAVGIKFASLHAKARKRNDVAPPPLLSLLEPRDVLAVQSAMGLSSTASQGLSDWLLRDQFRVRNNKNLSVVFRGHRPARTFSLFPRFKWSKTPKQVEFLCLGIWIPLLNDNPTAPSTSGVFPLFAASVADT